MSHVWSIAPKHDTVCIEIYQEKGEEWKNNQVTQIQIHSLQKTFDKEKHISYWARKYILYVI